MSPRSARPCARPGRVRAGVAASLGTAALVGAVLVPTILGATVANSAPTAGSAVESAHTAGPDADRLAGRFVFTTGPGLWFAVGDPQKPSTDHPTPPGATFVWATWATTQAGLGDAGIDWTLPAIGSVGPVSPGNDPGSCLDQGPTQGQFGFEVRPCDGSPNQRFQWAANGSALRDVGTGQYVGTGSTGHDDILQPTAISGTPAVIDSALLHVVPPSSEAAPVRIDSPAEGQVVTTKRPVFSGTGDPGATITISGPTGTIAETTVDGFSWSVASGVDLPDGTTTITVTQRTIDDEVSSVAL